MKKAVRDIITGKTFDNGVLCSSENSVVADEAVAEEVKKEFVAQGGYFMNKAEMDAVARVLVSPQRLPNPALVGKSATIIAEKCGITVPAGTRVLIAPLEGVGRDYPLSIEKLCPVLSFYVVKDWREGCERCKQILRYGGMGHTMSIHSKNDQVILEFGLKKPAFRIIVNSPTTLGSIGLTTGLDPAMTLGCGGYGGNITSDNISPKHLLNIKRLAYEVTPAATASAALAKSAAASASSKGISAETLATRVSAFLGQRGFGPATTAPAATVAPPARAPAPTPLDFVCEEDVRVAIQGGRKLIVSERAIITPAARELAETHRVLTVAPWRGSSSTGSTKILLDLSLTFDPRCNYWMFAVGLGGRRRRAVLVAAARRRRGPELRAGARRRR